MPDMAEPPEFEKILKRVARGWPELLEVESGCYPLLAQLDSKLSASVRKDQCSCIS